MSTTSVKLPETYIDAKNMVSQTIKESNKVSIRTYSGAFSLFANLCDITHHHIEEVEDEEGYANLDLTLTYQIRTMGFDETFTTIEKTRKIRVLNTLGDNLWTYRMIEKIWEGDYPSSVAVDMETGEVFFFSIKMNRIELTNFGKLTPNQFETFKYEVHDREPFQIKIDEKAMFDYIDGGEGLTHLQNNIIVEFNCSIPLYVRSSQQTHAMFQEPEKSQEG